MADLVSLTVQRLPTLQPIAIPSCCVSHIHIDLVGPLPCCDGANNLLTIIYCTDLHAGWSPFLSSQQQPPPLLNADALVVGWIARFCILAELTSDRGVQFSSDVWAVLMSRWASAITS